MKFSLRIPIDHVEPKGEYQTLEAVREMAVALDRSKAEACNITDHPAPDAHWLRNDPAGHDALDPFVGLAFVAACTTRLQLQTNVVVLPYRNPFLTAKAAATLQVLSNGRFTLGVGVGYQEAEFAAMGVPMSQRGALMDEALETIKLAWAGGAVVKRGKNFNAVGNEPRPVPTPPPAIWIGGGSDKAVERAARWGDGWTPFFAIPTNDKNIGQSALTSMAELGEKIRRLEELRAKAGKTGPVDICISARHHPKATTREEADKVLDSVHELARIGVNWARLFLPTPSRAGFIESLRWFDEEVSARL